MRKKRGLGRGLDALLSTPTPAAADTPPASGATASEERAEGFREIPVDLMQRGRYQPRVRMEPEALDELASSIRSQGVVQPVVVRKIVTAKGKEQRYEIIAGERRWRAAQLAGLDRVPAVIRDVSDDEALAMALIENIQREDLNPIEEAMALARFVEEFELTHQAAADAVGRSRVSVSNLIRLLDLDGEVRALMEAGELDMGQGRALLGLPGPAQRKAAAEVVAKGLTTRQTEALVRRLREGDDGAGKRAPSKSESADVAKLEQELSERIGAPVKIEHDERGRGRLVVRFSSLDEFEGIVAHIK